MQVGHCFEGLVGDQRCVGRYDQHMIAAVRGDDPEGHPQRVGGAQLAGLDDRLRVVGQGGHYLIGVGLHHHHRLGRLERSYRVENPPDHRPAGHPVNHLGKDRGHTRPPAGAQHDCLHGHGITPFLGWGDRSRTRTGGTKTRCAANYTTPHGLVVVQPWSVTGRGDRSFVPPTDHRWPAARIHVPSTTTTGDAAALPLSGHRSPRRRGRESPPRRWSAPRQVPEPAPRSPPPGWRRTRTGPDRSPT